MARSISRRSFLKAGAAVAATSVLAGCQPGLRRWVTLEPYVVAPEEQPDGIPTWYASVCRGCPAGCGIMARVMNGRAVKIEGNPEHPLNAGKLCANGQAGLQILYNPDRLDAPLLTAKRGSREFARLPWDSALSTLAAKVKDAGSAVAIVLGPTTSGHLVDLFQRLAKALGAPAPLVFDARSSWSGTAALSAANQALWGQGALSAYDLGGSDVIYSFGADFLGAGLSPTRYGIEYGRFRSQPKGARGYLVQFEPHMSITAAKADQWVPIAPGTEGLVAQAIARIIADEGLGTSDRIARAAALAGEINLASAAQAAGVDVQQLRQLAQVFAEAQRPLAIPGNGQSGAAGVTAAQALNAIAGGAGMALQGNPPAPALVRAEPAGYGQVQHLIGQMGSGAVKALLTYGTNLAYELPAQAGFLDALDKVGFVATFSPFMDEMGANSDMVLAERTYLESWGYAVVAPDFGVAAVTSQQPVVQPLNDARSAGDVLLAMAKQIPSAAGAFTWSDEVAFLREVAGGLPAGAAGGTGADAQWARFLQHGGWWPASAPASQPTPPPSASAPISVAAPQYQGDATIYPFHLHVFASPLLGISGANLPWLQGSPDPLTSMCWQTWVAINPATARKLGVQKSDVVRVTTPYGELEAPVYAYPAVRPDTIAVPLGQGHTDLGRYAQGRGASPLALLGGNAGPDGEPAWATVRCQVTPTGRSVNMATFEWTPGVEQGFFNQGYPGE